MKDPNYIEQALLPPFYRQVPRPPDGWPDRTTPEALKKAADIAHTNSEALRKSNNSLVLQVLHLQGEVKTARNWRWGIVASLLVGIFLLLLDLGLHAWLHK
jgi:hypothetical protein